jgi:hypothetical protein
MTSHTVTFKKLDLQNVSQKEVDQVIALAVYLVTELGLNYTYETIKSRAEGLIRVQAGELYGAYCDGDMIGLMGLIHNPEMWNAEDIVAIECAWYVKPAFRGLTGMRFIKYVEDNLECDKIRLGVGNLHLKRMLERQGYTCTKYVLEKVVYGRSSSGSGSE